MSTRGDKSFKKRRTNTRETAYLTRLFIIQVSTVITIGTKKQTVKVVTSDQVMLTWRV